MTHNKPAITRVGTVTDDGLEIVIKGWTLGLCALKCPCHRNPSGGHLALIQNIGGLLGLVCYRPGGCNCCEPWTARELAAVVNSFTALDTIDLPPEGDRA